MTSQGDLGQLLAALLGMTRGCHQGCQVLLFPNCCAFPNLQMTRSRPNCRYLATNTKLKALEKGLILKSSTFVWPVEVLHSRADSSL